MALDTVVRHEAFNWMEPDMDKMTSASHTDFLLGLVSRSVGREPQITLFSEAIDLRSHRRFIVPDGPGVAVCPPNMVRHPEMMEEDAERWDGLA